MLISTCCGAKVSHLDNNGETALCTDCGEWCGVEDEDEELTLGSADRF